VVPATVLSDGAVRTRGLGGTHTTTELGQAITNHIG
jgi:hypothetical protein